jgi:hypothetical protein
MQGDYPFSVEKLHKASSGTLSPPHLSDCRSSGRLKAHTGKRGVVLLACGSFSPITNMHLRIFGMLFCFLVLFFQLIFSGRGRTCVVQYPRHGHGSCGWLPFACHRRLQEEGSDGSLFLTHTHTHTHTTPHTNPFCPHVATKQGLAHAHHRVEMCKRAVESSDWIMVDGWESSKDEYQRTRVRMRRAPSHCELPFTRASLRNRLNGDAGGVRIL